MRKAIVVFTKTPVVGKTKTRLTEARGGALTPEEANALYEALFLDVIDCCLEAAGAELLVPASEVWICHDKDSDGEAFLRLLQNNLDKFSQITGIFSDEGGSFDACMQYAADYMLGDRPEGRRADGIVIVGGDLPTMQASILQDALDKLEKLSSLGEEGRIGPALVEGACQDGGFSLVGYTYTTVFDFYGVFYNTEGFTALDMLVDKARRANIPLGIVETMPDVDIPADLGSMIPVLGAMELAAASDPALSLPKRTLAVLEDIGLVAVATVPVKCPCP